MEIVNLNLNKHKIEIEKIFQDNISSIYHEIILFNENNLKHNFLIFENNQLLFKPTKASKTQFRTTRETALSYFIAGENTECDEDQGFALSKWNKITFENSQITINGDLGFAMGNYYFENESEKVKVEFSFGYREINDSIKIFLHHSSIPYKL